LGGRTGCTSFMVLLAAFVALLHRYTGQEDLVVGTPVSNRGRTELEQLIGMFVNTLVMRLDAAGDPTFRTLLARVRETALSAYAHQELPFEKLVEELHPQRDLSRNPLFQVTFQLFSSPDETTGPPSGGQPGICSDRASAVFDLAFNLWETAETITGQIEYSTDLFERETVEAMSSHFVKLIESAVECPDRHISELSLLSKADLHMIVTEWNRTAADYPRDATVHRLFEDQVLRTPDAIAVRFDGRSLTYAELNDKAERLARHLRGMGIRRGSRVALCLRRSGGMLAGLFGILKSGAAYVPLDPSYPAARLGFMLSDSEADAVVTDEYCAESVRDHKRVIRINDTGDVDSTADRQDQSAADHATADDIAYIIYTSGSTGTPKGVQIRHRSLVNYLTWCIREYDVASGEGSLVHSSIAFDLTITGLFAPLLAGKPVLLIDDADPSALAQALRERRDLSLIKITPPHLKVLSHEIPAVESAGRTRAFIVGGENLLAADIAFWRRWAPETALVNEYGPTETTVGCCTYRVPRDFRDTGSVPIGKPIANTKLYVLDGYLNPLPPGVPGELYIGGDGVAAGYFNRPELTAERFIRDPFEGSDSRLYKTGDIVRYLRDGNLEYLGRADNQVKIRGYRIELGEVEAVLAADPAVRQAAVVARQDAGGNQRLIGYVASSHAIPTELRRRMRERLPEYMVPSIFVVLDKLPLTSNGKIDSRSLPPPESANGSRSEHLAPLTEAERKLGEIWSALLGVGSIQADDNFFELGGHSLLAVQLVARIKSALSVHVSLRDVFESPTLAGLARCIDTGDREVGSI
jgi:amino acid adenylation domain-containing protein